MQLIKPPNLNYNNGIPAYKSFLNYKKDLCLELLFLVYVIRTHHRVLSLDRFDL